MTLATAGIGAYVCCSREVNRNTTLNPVTFAHYELKSKETVSQTSSVFILHPVRSGKNYELYDIAWRAGIWSVMFKQPQLQIGRDYTPLPPTDLRQTEAGGGSVQNEDESLRFLIRRDPKGEVSRYLHALKLGSDIEIRGPHIECEIDPAVQEILFIAGGTGIAPALQAAHTLLSRTNQTNHPRIHILWANRRRDDCIGAISDSPSLDRKLKRPWWNFASSNQQQHERSKLLEPLMDLPTPSLIVKELEALKLRYVDQIKVDYFVDEENTFISKEIIRRAADSLTPSTQSSKMIIVSGPPGFVNYMAGPKSGAHGQGLQGNVQGVIKDIGLDGWTVWKL